MRRAAGFTLLEMLVVFGIFALIGIISAQIVQRVADNHQTLQERGDRLIQVQRAMHIVQRDVMQLVDRPVRDVLGDPVDSVLIGADGMMEFTRTGWRNPLGAPRSNLQRVGYVLQDGNLFRAYWRVLDRTPDSEPVLQAMLSDVEFVEFFAIDAAGNQHSFWPRGDGTITDPSGRLVGVLMRIELPPFGVVERLWPVPPL
jgi:general secretion pathway protein J